MRGQKNVGQEGVKIRIVLEAYMSTPGGMKFMDKPSHATNIYKMNFDFPKVKILSPKILYSRIINMWIYINNY